LSKNTIDIPIKQTRYEDERLVMMIRIEETVIALIVLIVLNIVAKDLKT